MTDAISRPFSTEPTPEFRSVMASLDTWIKSFEEGSVTWDQTDASLAAMMRAVRFGDSTCKCGSDALNYPHRLERKGGDSTWWTATYRCADCGRTYTSGWADDLGGFG